MRAQRNNFGDWVVVADDAKRYRETRQAELTSRVLDGSSDHGYAAEYVGYGTVDGIPVKAIYLLNDEDMQDAGGEEYEDAGDFNWDVALEQGRIVVSVDELTDEQYEALTTTSEVTISRIEPKTMTIKAIKVNGGWTLEASNGDRPTEGRVVATRSQAYRECEALYPANSTWQGRKIGSGYRIVVD